MRERIEAAKISVKKDILSRRVKKNKALKGKKNKTECGLLFLYKESKLFEFYVEKKKFMFYEAECGCSTGITYSIL